MSKGRLVSKLRYHRRLEGLSESDNNKLELLQAESL